MEDRITKFVYDTFEITRDSKYHFKKLYGLTLVFKDDVITIKNRVSSYSLKPVGIIYEENKEFYFAPLDRTASLNEIVKEYVEKYLKNRKVILEEEYFPYPQQLQQPVAHLTPYPKSIPNLQDNQHGLHQFHNLKLILQNSDY